MELTIVPFSKDNYAYLIEWDEGAAVIDAGDAKPVCDVVHERNATIDYILSTHHHSDHTGGNRALKKHFDCKVVGPDDSRIEGLDLIVDRQFLFFEVIPVPAHTTSHVAYYLKEKGWLFTGDSLFNGGAGRLFEGTAEQMIESLAKLTALPNETLVYGGHEYTLANLTFALELEPNQKAIKRRLEKLTVPSVPSTLEEEVETNPFLRVHEPGLQQALGVSNGDAVETFKRLRRARNRFSLTKGLRRLIGG